MITIKDVADKAGVSKATVSRIINNKGSFSPDTIARVKQVMEELKYQPNEVARTLGKKRSKLISVIVPNKELPIFGIYIAELEKAAYEMGYRLLLCSSLFDREEEMKAIMMLRNNMVDGIIYGGFNHDVSHFQNVELPIVTIGRKVADHIPMVSSDNHMSGILAASHLCVRKCKKVIYISAFPAGLSWDGKYEGIMKVFQKENIECFAYEVPFERQLMNTPAQLITKALLEHPDADGIISEMDLIALNCIHICASLGYRIPEDIKIVGFGNHFYSIFSNPPLTTIEEPIEAISKAAMKILVDEIENGNGRREDIFVPVTLIERKTT